MNKEFENGMAARHSLIKDLAIGFCIGTANIIPGVSGGTFLLIFRIYDRFLSTLANINKANFLEFVRCLHLFIFTSGKTRTARKTMEFLTKNDFIFLMKLMAGAVAAIVSLSTVMEYLIVHHFAVTYALFFGLILVSIIIPVKLMKHRKARLVCFVFLGAAATVYVTCAVNPYDKVKMKSDIYESQYSKDVDRARKNPASIFSFSGQYTLNEYAYAFCSGAVAISAMVLPGISGSLVLILMGEYFAVVSAISGLKTLGLDHIFFLGCFSAGIIFGGLLFARLVSAAMKRYYDPAMAFLTGLMAGSLYALWPFKKTVLMAEQFIQKEGVITLVENARVYTNVNVLPPLGADVYLSLVSFAVGCIIMAFFAQKG